jgi:Permuted papain-like amidase enzyme, YaeF/YiiX, C92 family
MLTAQRPDAAIASVILTLSLHSLLAGAAEPASELRVESRALPNTSVATLASALKVGDVVFIRVSARPFREVALATNSWTNHVGIVVDTSKPDPLIGESTFPLSRTTSWSSFVERSEGGRVSVERLGKELTPEQALALTAAVNRRAGIFYDTGFDLHSRRQFCSRYVREVLLEATGTTVGQVETFSHLLKNGPNANIGFWRVWYFGSIPWKRETVTPASILSSPELTTVFDGTASAASDPQAL